MNAKVAIVKCETYLPQDVELALSRALALLGGIEGFIAPKSKVLLKPNLLMAKEPEYAITTHPQVVRSLIRLLKVMNCRVFVGDGPSVWGSQIENVDKVYEVSGIAEACREEGAELVKFENKRWRGNFPLTTWLDQCDYLVNLPKFKTHSFTVLSGAIKNNFGLVWGTQKTELHKKYFKAEDFANMLVDVFEQARPCLNIMDGIYCLEGDGPASGGRVRRLGLLLASGDAVAMDSVMAMLVGLRPQDILTTKFAAQRNLGAAAPESIAVLGEGLQQVADRSFLLPVSNSLKRRVSPFLIRALRNFIRYYPYTKHDKCLLCRACIDACPKKVITMRQGRIVFDYSGCIACFCCAEACPASAVGIKKSLLAKLAGF